MDNISNVISDPTFVQLHPAVQITLILAVTACFGMVLYYVYRMVTDN